MMEAIKKFLILTVILFALSCSNDDSSNKDENNGTVKDIYVCGSEKIINNGKLLAIVWKNGVATSLTDGTKNASASDIFVVGEKVYVVGSEDNNSGEAVAKIWINGVPENLTDEPSFANKVIVSGSYVYVLGHVFENGSYVEKIWKNGVVSEIQGLITNFAVNNEDVYTVGFDNQRAKVWKNGVSSNLTNGMFYSVANDIEIKDNDVYIVGEEDIESISVAKLWKNGVGSNLSDVKLHSTAKEISIVGNDIYVSGTQNNPAYTSIIWKNGKEIWSKENIQTKGLKVIGKDFYMLSNAEDKAKILKNGVVENLSSAFYSNANALFITTN